MLLNQLLFVGVLILVGVLLLSLRRKADGSRTGYKLILVLLGILLSLSSVGFSSTLTFDSYFLKAFSVFLLVVLLFELSVRLNTDNIDLGLENVGMFFSILVMNIIVLGISATFLLNVQFIQAVILAIILSSVEYFLVDKLKSEGDLANPLVILFAFSMMVFYSLGGNVFDNIVYFLKYIIIGIGVGVLAGIIVFRMLRNQYINVVNELGIVAVAVTTYIISEQLAGSGLFAVLILGTFFGNSYVRKTTDMKSFSPFIFKTLEMLIYLMVGFVAVITFKDGLWWKSFVIFLAYILLRLLIIHMFYRHYSFENKLLLTFAPKGMVLSVMILVLGTYGDVASSLVTVMLFVLIYSLIAGVFLEYVEQQKALRLDKTLKALLSMRFGRKRDLLKKRH